MAARAARCLRFGNRLNGSAELDLGSRGLVALVLFGEVALEVRQHVLADFAAAGARYVADRDDACGYMTRAGLLAQLFADALAQFVVK